MGGAHLATRGGEPFDFSRNPMLVYWEMTQACGLACKHCRAEAVPNPHPQELTTFEGKSLLTQLLAFGVPLPHLILTGGDPLSRKDIYSLIDYAVELGFEVSITPSATPADIGLPVHTADGGGGASGRTYRHTHSGQYSGLRRDRR